MKKLFTTIMLLCCVFAAHAASLTENFESGLPSSSPSSETKVTLTSGEWTVKGVYGKKDNNSMRATMSSTDSYIITPAIDRPGSIMFYHRASGSGKKLIVEKSTDGGATWTQLGEVTVSSSTPYGVSSFNANSAEDDTQVLIKFTCKSATIYLDDISIAYGTAGSGSGGGESGGTEPVNPEPQPEIAWTGPHSVEHCIYVASWAPDDSGDGSWEKPYYNLQKAVDQAQPGDTIYVRGGTYYPSFVKQKSRNGVPATTTMVELTAKGTADKQFTIRTFPGEFPVLNFKDQLKGTNSTIYRGILITGDYWNVSGLHITQAGDNGLKIEGSHNTVRNCTFSYNDDTGLQIGFTHTTSNDGSLCAYNAVIDCDSYQNADSDNGGADADGFACKMYAGVGNRFIRCRAWNNSDDGWDFYETEYTIGMYECWAWGSGRKADHPNISGFQGNGNGMKLGGNGNTGVHEAWNCITFNNKDHGFDENHNKGGVKLYNCLAFGDGTYDYFFEECNNPNNFHFFNNISLGRVDLECGSSNYTASNNVCSNDNDSKMGWGTNAVTGYSAADFVSLTEEDAKAPRGADGSMPTRFARLKSTSVFIDKGVDKSLPADVIAAFPFLEQPIYGNGRDIGPYEYRPLVPTGAQLILTNSKALSLEVAHGNIQFTVPADGKARVDLYSPQGTLVSTVANLLTTAGGQYSVPVSAQLQPGIYIARLTANGETKSIKFSKQ